MRNEARSFSTPLNISYTFAENKSTRYFDIHRLTGNVTIVLISFVHFILSDDVLMRCDLSSENSFIFNGVKIGFLNIPYMKKLGEYKSFYVRSISRENGI